MLIKLEYEQLSGGYIHVQEVWNLRWKRNKKKVAWKKPWATFDKMLNSPFTLLYNFVNKTCENFTQHQESHRINCSSVHLFTVSSQVGVGVSIKFFVKITAWFHACLCPALIFKILLPSIPCIICCSWKVS